MRATAPRRRQPAVRHGLKIVPLIAVADVRRRWPASRKTADLPELTQPVNDFANVIDARSAAEMDRMIRALQAATGDVVVVATVPTIEPYGDIREYAVKLFENHGRGIGQKGKDNGLLILLAVKERQGVDRGRLRPRAVDHRRLRRRDEPRLYMVPEFRDGRYGDGLAHRCRTDHRPDRAGPQRHAPGRSQRRADAQRGARSSIPVGYILLGLIILLAVSRIGGGPRGGVSTLGPPRVERLVERRRAVRRRRLGGGFGGRRFRRRLRRVRRRIERRRRRRRELVMAATNNSTMRTGRGMPCT